MMTHAVKIKSSPLIENVQTSVLGYSGSVACTVIVSASKEL
jgi:hypothetical protein